MTRPIHYPAGPGSAESNATVPKIDIGDRKLLQIIGEGEHLNGAHWNIPDGGSVPPHEHASEQLGYVIRGRLELIVGDETLLIGEGDAYVIPSNRPHAFRAIGDVEAIDVFSPPRDFAAVLGRRP